MQEYTGFARFRVDFFVSLWPPQVLTCDRSRDRTSTGGSRHRIMLGPQTQINSCPRAFSRVVPGFMPPIATAFDRRTHPEGEPATVVSPLGPLRSFGCPPRPRTRARVQPTTSLANRASESSAWEPQVFPSHNFISYGLSDKGW